MSDRYLTGLPDRFAIVYRVVDISVIDSIFSADDYTADYMRSGAMVSYDGTVFWPPPTRLRSLCKIDITYFPFDSQWCYLKFGSWTYHGMCVERILSTSYCMFFRFFTVFQVDVTNRSDSVDLTNYVVSGEFELVRVHQKRRVVKYTCCSEPYPDLTFSIHLRRKTLYYTYKIVGFRKCCISLFGDCAPACFQIFPCVMMSALTLIGINVAFFYF